jgi:hypothetical protein
MDAFRTSGCKSVDATLGAIQAANTPDLAETLHPVTSMSAIPAEQRNPQ